MARTLCTDRVVGAILASWRYDISGITPEMRKDYEQHLTECAHCRSRQKFHRSLDGTLAVLTALSMISFLFALAVLQRVKFMEHVAFNILGLDTVSMYQMLVSAAFAGLGFSLIAFILVLVTTPASSYLGGMAADRARLLEARLPEAIRSLRSRSDSQRFKIKSPHWKTPVWGLCFLRDMVQVLRVMNRIHSGPREPGLRRTQWPLAAFARRPV